MSICVSVIVPIYNSEKYLSECLDSLANQTLENMEIICVNDGSTDSSKKIIEEYMIKDSRFKILDKENSGYGISMNAGFQMANGEYIGIVESDDYVEPDMFESLYNTAKKNSVDVIKSSFYRFTTENGKHKQQYMRYTTVSDRVICPADYPKILMNTTANWTGLYRRGFIVDNKIIHNETPGASYQDIGFHFITLSLANRAYFDSKPYYHYRFDNPNSSIHDKTKMFVACREYDYIQSFYNSNPDLKRIFEGVLWARMHNTYMNIYDRLPIKMKYEFLDYYRNIFGNAMRAGALTKQSFNDKRWNEMINILTNCDDFHNEYMWLHFDKHKSITNLPYLYRGFEYYIKKYGFKATYEYIMNKVKERLNIKHWDVMDKIAMHCHYDANAIINKMDMGNLFKKTRRIKQLKNKYGGKRCFIVCTGPSLKMNDLELIRNEYTFGMNSIYLAYPNTTWRPSFYTCIDSYAQERMSKEYSIDYLNIAKNEVFLNECIECPNFPNVYKIPINFRNHDLVNIQTNNVVVQGDLSVGAYDCFSVTNFAITCAIFLGFSEIYIIGCDCNYSGSNIHFVQSKLDPKTEEKNRWSDAVELSIKGYTAMKRYAEDNNVKIYNATRGGMLEVFERVDFESLFDL